MGKIIFDENKIRFVQAELVQTISEKSKLENYTKKFASEAVDAYIERSVKETEPTCDEAGAKTGAKTSYMKGLFITEEVDWKEFISKLELEGYRKKESPLGVMIEKKMGMKELDIFPPTIVKDFPKKTRNKKEEFCKVIIKFDPKILSKSEAISHLSNIREEANEDSEWAREIFDWFNAEEKYKFYFIVGFEIFVEFDYDRYGIEYFNYIIGKQALEKEVITDQVFEGDEFLKIHEFLFQKMIKEAIKFADYAIEYVVEKLVYNHLRDAFNNMYKKLENMRKWGRIREQ